MQTLFLLEGPLWLVDNHSFLKSDCTSDRYSVSWEAVGSYHISQIDLFVAHIDNARLFIDNAWRRRKHGASSTPHVWWKEEREEAIYGCAWA